MLLKLLFHLISPTLLIASILKSLLDRTETIKTLNSFYFYLAIASVVVLLCFEIIDPDYKAMLSNGFIVFWMCFVVSRALEIGYAFIKDATEKVAKLPQSGSQLSYQDRVKLALKSYGELLFGFATLYNLSPVLWWCTSDTINIGTCDSPSTIANAIYFSGVTLTTLGYGDITPISIYAQLLTVLQVFVGFSLLIVSFAIYVGHGLSENKNSKLPINNLIGNKLIKKVISRDSSAGLSRRIKLLNWNVCVEKAIYEFFSLLSNDAKKYGYFEALYVSRDKKLRHVQLHSGAHPIEMYETKEAKESGYKIVSEDGASIVISQVISGEVVISLYPYKSQYREPREKYIVWAILNHPDEVTHKLLRKLSQDFFIYSRVSSCCFSDTFFERLKVRYLNFKGKRYSEGSYIKNYIANHFFVIFIGVIGSFASIYSVASTTQQVT